MQIFTFITERNFFNMWNILNGFRNGFSIGKQ